MEAALASLRRRRTGMLLLNLGYFLALLAVGVLVFLRGGGGAGGYLLIALCVAAYLLAVRPVTRRYTGAVRAAILEHAVCAGIEDFRHAPREGVPAGAIRASGLLNDNSGRAFVSRERVTGRCGGMELELADVSFPIVEEGRNTMFSGACLLLSWPGVSFPAATVRAGQPEDGLRLPKQQLELLEEIGSLIPGSLYLQTAGDRLTLLLRGRFLGFPVNPLMPLTEKSLTANPFPELERAMALARAMRPGR